MAMSNMSVTRRDRHSLIASQISTGGGIRQAAQKTDLKLSTVRNVSLNTGFVGSKWLSSPCLVCGCSTTPFAVTAAPSGTVFSDPANAAGSTLDVAAGDMVELVMSGLPGPSLRARLALTLRRSRLAASRACDA